MPSHKRKLMDDATRRVLADHRIVRYTIDTTAGNHGRVTFLVGARKGVIIYPSSASDHRAIDNHRAFTRRLIRKLRAEPEAQARLQAA